MHVRGRCLTLTSPSTGGNGGAGVRGESLAGFRVKGEATAVMAPGRGSGGDAGVKSFPALGLELQVQGLGFGGCLAGFSDERRHGSWREDKWWC